MQHQLKTCDCGACPVCNWGAAVCDRCQGTEGELATDCPGTPMTDEQRESVLNRRLDYRNGVWEAVTQHPWHTISTH